MPKFDAATIDGLITALRSPAVNVRAIGFAGLKARGASAVNAVAALLNDPNPYMRGRAIFLLYQLGPEGRKRAGTPESQTDPALKIAAYRAMRRADLDVLPTAARLARDADAGVRREVALSLRDQPADAALDILVDIARGYDGQDRSYLEALGTGATGKEAALYERLRTRARREGRSDRLAAAFTWIAWRLHVPAAVADLTARAQSSTLSLADRRLRDGHARVRQRSGGVEGDAGLAAADSALREPATWWLLNRMSNDWAGLRPAPGAQGGRDLRSRRDRAEGSGRAAGRPPICRSCSVDEIARSPATPRAERTSSARCQICHSIGGAGAELGPALDGWARGKSTDVIATAIVRPSAEIAHGYEGIEIKTKDGLTIQGVLIKEGDPLMMRSMGGVTQIIPADRVGIAPPDAGVADDERRAAGPHRAGRRRPHRVPSPRVTIVAMPMVGRASTGAHPHGTRP